MPGLLQLYPTPSRPLPLYGLYLSHDLRQYAETTGKPFVYTNFVASLDGRIAISHSNKSGIMTIPAAIANSRDLRLFQELAAQADVLIISERYLRDLTEGRAQEILRMDDPEFSDLAAWRIARSLPIQPALAVVSASLNFTIPAHLAGRSGWVFTVNNTDPDQVHRIERQGWKVIIAGETSVDGREMIRMLAEMGYRTIYNSTGPKVMHLLLAAGALDRLYITHTNRILGGYPFLTIVEGDLLQPPADFRLNTLYLDPHGLKGLGQLFASYDRA